MSAEKIMPKRVVDETRVIVEMRTRTAFLGSPIDPRAVRQNADRIARLIASIVQEHDGYSAQVQEVTRTICPECELDWELDPDTGLPACCDAAMNSWAVHS